METRPKMIEAIAKLEETLRQAVDQNTKKTAALALRDTYNETGNPELAKKYELMTTKYVDLLAPGAVQQLEGNRLRFRQNAEFLESKLISLEQLATTHFEHQDRERSGIAILIMHGSKMYCTTLENVAENNKQLNSINPHALSTRLYACHELLSTYKESKKSVAANTTLKNHQRFWDGLCHLYSLENKNFSPRLAIPCFDHFIRENATKDVQVIKEAKYYKAVAILHCIIQAQKEKNVEDEAHFIDQLLKDTSFIEHYSDCRDLANPLFFIMAQLQNREHFLSLFNIFINIGLNNKNHPKQQEEILKSIKILLQQKQNSPECVHARQALLQHLRKNRAIAIKQKNEPYQKLLAEQLIPLFDEKEIPVEINQNCALMQQGIVKQNAEDIRTALENLTFFMTLFSHSLRKDQRDQIEAAILAAYTQNPQFSQMENDLCEIAHEKILNPENGFSQSLRGEIFKKMKNKFLENPKYHERIRQDLLAVGEQLKTQIVSQALSYDSEKGKRLGDKFKHKNFKKDYKTAEAEYLNCVEQKDEAGCQRVTVQFKMALLYYATRHTKGFKFPNQHKKSLPLRIECTHFLEDILLHNALNHTPLDARNTSYWLYEIFFSHHPRRDKEFLERFLSALTLCVHKDTDNPQRDANLRWILHHLILEHIQKGNLSESYVDRALHLLSPCLKTGNSANRTLLAYAASKGNAWALIHLDTHLWHNESETTTTLDYLRCKIVLLSEKDHSFPPEIVAKAKKHFTDIVESKRKNFKIASWYLDVIKSAEGKEIGDVDIYLHQAANNQTNDILTAVKKGAKCIFHSPEKYEAWIKSKIEDDNTKKAIAATKQATVSPLSLQPTQTQPEVKQVGEKKAEYASIYPSEALAAEFAATTASAPTSPTTYAEAFADAKLEEQLSTLRAGAYPSFFREVESAPADAEITRLYPFFASTPEAQHAVASAPTADASQNAAFSPSAPLAEASQDAKEDDWDREFSERLKRLNESSTSDESPKLFSRRTKASNNNSKNSERVRLITS